MSEWIPCERSRSLECLRPGTPGLLIESDAVCDCMIALSWDGTVLASRLCDKHRSLPTPPSSEAAP